MQSLAAIILVFCALWPVAGAWAGGSGLNAIVVVNQSSTNSLQLGNDYCELRGVPPQNVLRLTNWTGGSIDWSPSDFQTQLLNPLLAMVNSRGLAPQAQFVVLSMDIPYRVTDGSNENSTTAALFYGFKTNTVSPDPNNPSCSLPDNSSNSYAYSELPFSQAPPNTASTNSFLAMLLTDTNLAAAENTLHRALAADSSFPTQMVYLAKTDDPFRNVRYPEFDNAVFENQVVGNYAVTRITTDATTFTNLFGFQTGSWQFSLETNEFVPGGLGDTLTSFSGYILDPYGQTTALAFLEAGASGSYGTIVEPCNYTQKFPDPVDYFYQTRGFSLAEAYYQSVLNPFEGLFVGEPLTAPFAHPGAASWTSPTNGAVLAGQSPLSLNFTAAATNLPVAQVDLFVDGTFFQTMTNLPPAAGNVLSVVLNGSTIAYTVPTNATLASVATGLAAALNLQSNLTGVATFPIGDRIELQSLSLSVPGSNVTLSAGAAAGAAPALTTGLTPARPAFLDSGAIGYQLVTVTNSPLVGDWLQVMIMKTNGVTITLAVTNSVSGTTVGTLAQNLVNLINANASLQTSDGLLAADFFDYDPYGQSAAQLYLYARTPGWPASEILATWSSSTNLQVFPAGTNPLADNVGDLRPRNHLYVNSGQSTLAVNFPLDTTQIADGWHQLTAVAYEGTSVATQTRITRNIVVQNTSLSATLAALPAGSNATLAQSLQFTITANTTNVSRIELFSTGGSLGAQTNQAAATFVVSPGYLGLGLHPFYALVTDQAGHHYQTATVSYRLVPVISLTLTRTPPTLVWTAVPNDRYDLLFTTNLPAAFQTVATITATNSVVQWPITTTGSAGFYQVKLDP
jgi:uncharacterized protein (TIGR03790 family)